MSGWKLTALVVVLALSLLGNALAIGAGVRLYALRAAMLGDGAAVTLPRTMRRDLVAGLSAHKEQLHPALAAVQNTRRDAVLALTAKPYDEAKATAALDALRAAVSVLMQQGQGVVLETMRAKAGG